MSRFKADQIKITKKLPAIMIAICFFAVLVVASAAYFRASLALRENAKASVVTAASTSAEMLKVITSQVASDLQAMSVEKKLVQGMQMLTAAYTLEPGGAAALQQRYITDNPHPVGERQMLIDGGSHSNYDLQHADLQPGFLARLEQMG